jgi:hypothetical protein
MRSVIYFRVEKGNYTCKERLFKVISISYITKQIASLSFGYEPFLIIELRVYKDLSWIYNSPSKSILRGKVPLN